MVPQQGKNVMHKIVLCAVVGMQICMSGCKTTPYMNTGTPLGQGELVGGGLKIEWTAPAKGTAFLIESTTNRIVETRSLDDGETYSFSPAEGSKNEFEHIFGVKMADARFLLYFRPANSKSTEP
jgi:hypothetical protein